MAAISAAPPSATALTPPSSSHGNEDPWIYAVRSDEPTKLSLEGARGPLSAHNANSKASPNMSSFRSRSTNDLLSRATADQEDDDDDVRHGRGEKRTAADAMGKGGNAVENSKWIHRDKLARIECEELQAAGIMMPRSIPRPRKDRSTDRLTGITRQTTESPEQAHSSIARPKTRSGRDSVSSWDLKTLEDAADGSGSLRGANGSAKSRIPVPKFTPPPTTPLDDMDNFDLESTVVSNASKDSSANLNEPVSHTNTRARSRSTGASMSLGPGTPPGSRSGRRNTTTEPSPKKAITAGARKSAAKNGSAATRPKTRGAERTTSSAGRPTTRSGDLSPGTNKKPEGDPPWMVSAYKPDPRLPPDQQLLPTVARRLKQEQWEKEGKFGNVYDKEFRPLTDEGFFEPPDPSTQPAPTAEIGTEETPQSDWPLKQEAPPRSPTLHRGNSYSTMPKISDKPPSSPITTSPKVPQSPLQRQPSRTSVKQVIRVPDEPEESADAPEAGAKGKGCGLCCIVM